MPTTAAYWPRNEVIENGESSAKRPLTRHSTCTTQNPRWPQCQTHRCLSKRRRLVHVGSVGQRESRACGLMIGLWGEGPPGRGGNTGIEESRRRLRRVVQFPKIFTVRLQKTVVLNGLQTCCWDRPEVPRPARLRRRKAVIAKWALDDRRRYVMLAD